MAADGVSAFKFYSVGIIAENKPLSTNDALVVPMEILPLLDGEIGVEDEKIEHKGLDQFDKHYTVSVNSRNALVCHWLQLGSNRKTAPDVRKGERVAIYRFGDSDIFYWKELGLDDHLRRLETVTYLFSDVPDGTSDEPLTAENCYVVEVSTHQKTITLTTVKTNGEPFAYTMQLNTDVGAFTLTDDVGNYIQLDSADTAITFENANKTHMRLDKDEIYAKAITNIWYEAGENFTLDAGDSISVSAVNSISFKCTDYNVNASSTVNVEAPTINFKGKFNLDGDQSTTGTTTIQGATKVGSLGSTSGNLSVESKIVTSTGMQSSAPISGPSNTI
jgi:hypothetical protein